MFVCFLLVHPLFLLSRVFFLGISKFIFELLDDVKVSVGDLLIVVLYVVVLLRMLLGQLLYRSILLVFNLLDEAFALPLHFFSDQEHLVFVLQLNFIGYPLVLLPHLSGLLVLLSSQRIQILLMSHFLLFFGYLHGSEILLQLSLIDSVLVFLVLKRYLRFLLQLSQLIQILKHQVLHSLLVDFDFNFVFFF